MKSPTPKTSMAGRGIGPPKGGGIGAGPPGAGMGRPPMPKSPMGAGPGMAPPMPGGAPGGAPPGAGGMGGPPPTPPPGAGGMGGAGGFAKGGVARKMGKEGSAIEERTEGRKEAMREGDVGAFAKGGDVKPRHSGMVHKGRG